MSDIPSLPLTCSRELMLRFQVPQLVLNHVAGRNFLLFLKTIHNYILAPSVTKGLFFRFSFFFFRSCHWFCLNRLTRNVFFKGLNEVKNQDFEMCKYAILAYYCFFFFFAVSKYPSYIAMLTVPRVFKENISVFM